MRIADDELMDDRVIAERLREVGARRPRRGGRLSALSRSLFQQGFPGNSTYERCRRKVPSNADLGFHRLFKYLMVT